MNWSQLGIAAIAITQKKSEVLHTVFQNLETNKLIQTAYVKLEIFQIVIIPKENQQLF